MKNTLKIQDGLRVLTSRPFEIISGVMVQGSLDMDSLTISVLPSGAIKPIDGVLLNALTNESKGVILIPKDGSGVIIASIDGPGEWTLIKPSEIVKVIVTIENVSFKMDGTRVEIKNSDVTFSVGVDVLKLNTSSESLFQLLKDCFTYITELTVPTPSGTSGVPVNIADFTNLISRLNNLLGA